MVSTGNITTRLSTDMRADCPALHSGVKVQFADGRRCPEVTVQLHIEAYLRWSQQGSQTSFSVSEYQVAISGADQINLNRSASHVA